MGRPAATLAITNTFKLWNFGASSRAHCACVPLSPLDPSPPSFLLSFQFYYSLSTQPFQRLVNRLEVKFWMTCRLLMLTFLNSAVNYNIDKPFHESTYSLTRLSTSLFFTPIGFSSKDRQYMSFQITFSHVHSNGCEIETGRSWGRIVKIEGCPVMHKTGKTSGKRRENGRESPGKRYECHLPYAFLYINPLVLREQKNPPVTDFYLA